MKLEAIAPGNLGIAPRIGYSEKLDQSRKALQSLPEKKVEKEVSSEELLQKIKELSQDGLYSVRFETHPDTHQLVIRVVDQVSGDVIRQIPSEELLQISKSLQNLRGIVIDTQS